MGCINLPSTLKGWATYCDCLESTTSFQHTDTEPSEHCSNDSNILEKKLQKGLSPLKTTQRDKPEKISDLQTPPPAKRGRQLKRILNNKDHLILKKVEKDDTIDEVSDISEPRHKQVNIFDVQRLQEDLEEAKQNHLPHFYKPVAPNGYEKRARSAASSMGYLHPKKSNELESNDLEYVNLPYNPNLYRPKYFIHEEEQSQFAHKQQ